MAFIFCFGLAAEAQQTNDRFINFSYLDGLPDKAVYSFAQDKQGFLWVGSISGLYRYDGSKFKHFKSDQDDDQNQISNTLTNILYDVDHNVIWLSSISDLQYFDVNTYTFHRLPKSNLFDFNLGWLVNCLFKKDKDHLCIGTIHGLYEYDIKAKNWKEIIDIWPNTKKTGSKKIQHIERIDQSKVAIATNKMVIIYDWKKNDTISSTINISESIYHMVYDSLRGNLWLSCISEMVKVDVALHNSQVFKIKQANSELNAKVHHMVLLDENHLFISGNIKFDLQRETYELIKSGAGMYDNQLLYVSNQFVDRQGNLWLGSYESVCSMMPFQNQSVVTYPIISANKEGIEVVKALKPEGTNELYVSGPPLVGIQKIDLNTGKKNKITNGWPTNKYSFFIIQLKTGKIVACSEQDLYVLDTAIEKFKPVSLFSNITPYKLSNIKSIIAYKENKLVLSTGSEVIIIDVENGQCTIYTLNKIPNMTSRYFDPIFVNQTGCIFFASISGLYVLDENIGEIQKMEFSESNTGRKIKHIKSALEDKKGNLWVTTSLNGLFKYTYDTKQLKNINKGNSKLTTDFLQSIALDPYGNIIVGSPTEIYKIHPETMSCYGVYKKQNGFMRDDQAYGISVQGDYLIKNNFASIDLLSLKQYKKNHYDEKPILTSFEVMNIDKLITPISTDTTFHLKYDENLISISYSSLNLSNSNQETYKYRLLGLDTTWTYYSSPKVTFSRLPAGKYYFEVFACNNDGVCSVEPLKISFVISKVFYLQWWFITLSLSILLTLGYYLYNQKIMSVRNEEKLKNKYEKQLKAVEMNALRAQMNPHFIFNSLNSIQKFIFTKDEYAALNISLSFHD